MRAYVIDSTKLFEALMLLGDSTQVRKLKSFSSTFSKGNGKYSALLVTITDSMRWELNDMILKRKEVA